MKYNFFLVCFSLLVASVCAQPVVSFRVEKTESDTAFVVNRSVLTMPDGTKVIEEIWRPVNIDSLKGYLAKLENQEIEAAKQDEFRATSRRENADRMKKERDKDGGGNKDIALPPVVPDPKTPKPKAKKKS